MVFVVFGDFGYGALRLLLVWVSGWVLLTWWCLDVGGVVSVVSFVWWLGVVFGWLWVAGL